jgi:ADP-ribose pyrophosphatase YjhB (NUDIX family)
MQEDQKNFKACTLFLCNAEGKFVLQLKDRFAPTPFVWTPLGGFREDNETPAECIRREMQEELPDYELKNLQFMGTFVHPKRNDMVGVFFSIDENLDIKRLKEILQEGETVDLFNLNLLSDLNLNLKFSLDSALAILQCPISQHEH